MNINLDKEEFFELITVFIVEEAKARGKELVGVDPDELTEYEQLLGHIAKFPMKTPLKMARFKVTPAVKMYRRRLITGISNADRIRVLL